MKDVLGKSAMKTFTNRNWLSPEHYSMSKGPRPVHFRSYLIESNTCVSPHLHEFAQFHFARKGNMRLETADNCWIVPSHYGIWIPAYMEHAVWAMDDVFLESLDIETELLDETISMCQAVTISDVAKELIHHASETIPELYDEHGKDGKLVSVLLDIIFNLPQVDFVLPWPKNPALNEMCRTILESPGAEHYIEIWSAKVGMSTRNFSRKFKTETGLSFSLWKQKMRIFESVIMLKQNKSVTTIALEMGYSSTAAFSYSFKTILGVPPTEYAGQS
jgi:AraC-like DNA-binding protein